MTLTTRVTIAGRKIVLTPDLLLGDGREAMVYRHPADAGLAVKVLATPDRSYRRKLEVILARSVAIAAGIRYGPSSECYPPRWQTGSELHDAALSANGPSPFTLE